MIQITGKERGKERDIAIITLSNTEGTWNLNETGNERSLQPKKQPIAVMYIRDSKERKQECSVRCL